MELDIERWGKHFAVSHLVYTLCYTFDGFLQCCGRRRQWHSSMSHTSSNTTFGPKSFQSGLCLVFAQWVPVVCGELPFSLQRSNGERMQRRAYWYFSFVMAQSAVASDRTLLGGWPDRFENEKWGQWDRVGEWIAWSLFRQHYSSLLPSLPVRFFLLSLLHERKFWDCQDRLQTVRFPNVHKLDNALRVMTTQESQHCSQHRTNRCDKYPFHVSFSKPFDLYFGLSQ